ncbi:M13 family metallopeptidase, partial [Klebsiella pneumoniae]|nr:M13 family metallopeptidase [Klebsiella pneumoniae]
MIEQASAGQAKDGNAQRIGVAYASFMDEAAAEKKGLQPIEPDLQAITLLASRNELLKLIGGGQSGNVKLPLALYVGIDARDATGYLPDLYQSGLLMPD